MENYISISQLNDFVFCPYSIYLHNIYRNADENLYHATPQTQGKASHTVIDEQKYSSRKNEISGISVYSDEFGIAGKIDIYKISEKHLIERKHKLEKIYLGQIYQLWGQYFCMKEMGYEIESLSFYAISTNKSFPVEIPTEEDRQQFLKFIDDFKKFNPENAIETNENNCRHCIYNNLCDKTEVENVYK
jgi:CRISPR-associated protein Cas4